MTFSDMTTGIVSETSHDGKGRRWRRVGQTCDIYVDLSKNHTDVWRDIDTLANCIKVEHDKM